MKTKDIKEFETDITVHLTRISGDRSEDLNLDLIKESNESTIFVGFIFSWE